MEYEFLCVSFFVHRLIQMEYQQKLMERFSYFYWSSFSCCLHLPLLFLLMLFWLIPTAGSIFLFLHFPTSLPISFGSFPPSLLSSLTPSLPPAHRLLFPRNPGFEQHKTYKIQEYTNMVKSCLWPAPAIYPFQLPSGPLMSESTR